jgi:hypothetical protein
VFRLVTTVTDPIAHAELRKTLELILADVGAWDQEQWGVKIPLVHRDSNGVRACRTAFCVAGHYAVSVAGYEPVWYPADHATGDDYAADGAPVAIEGMAQVVVPVAAGDPRVAGVVEEVSTVAARAFGLTGNAANVLFRESNSLRRVLDVAYHATGGAVDLYAAYEELVARDPEFAERERATELHSADVDYAWHAIGASR